ncbi:MAG: hypothetical protein ACHQAX_01185 [Gammaproteobacteria bacterium]
MKFQKIINTLLELNAKMNRPKLVMTPAQAEDMITTKAELKALAKDEHTNSIAIKVFLYERWERIKNQSSNYHRWPLSPMNEICIELANAINPYALTALIMPKKHPRQTRKGLTKRDLYTHDEKGFTPFYYVVIQNDIDSLEDMVHVAGKDILKYKFGPEEFHTPLTTAALHSNETMLKKIIEMLGPDAFAPLGEQPLHWLAYQEYSVNTCKMADILIEEAAAAGADCFLNTQGAHRNFWGKTPFEIALYTNNWTFFAGFLIRRGADVNINDELHQAWKKNSCLLPALIERKDIGTLAKKNDKNSIMLDHLLRDTLNHYRNSHSFSVSGIRNLVEAGAQIKPSDCDLTCGLLKWQGGISLAALLSQNDIFDQCEFKELCEILRPDEHTTSRLIILYARGLVSRLSLFDPSTLPTMSSELQLELKDVDTAIETIEKVDRLRIEILKVQKINREKPNFSFSIFSFSSKLTGDYARLPENLRGPLIGSSHPDFNMNGDKKITATL